MKAQTMDLTNGSPIPQGVQPYETAAGLLRSGGNLPRGVYEILRYCIKKDVPATFTQNEPAGSCLDACGKRVRRNGVVGIALRDEMKSLVCTYTDAEKKKRHVALHCRGDQSIDFKKADILLAEIAGVKAHLSLLDEVSLSKAYRLCFGIVNPALLDVRSGGKLLQIFDAGLLEGYPPELMMTNAGDHTWGMEFDAARLIRAVDARMIGTICK